MADLQDLLKTLEEIAPLSLAASWDNVGLLVQADPSPPVEHILLTIDFTREVALEAIEGGVDLVIAYHPPIFDPLKRLTADHPIAMAVRAGLHLYSPHTALDAVVGGTCDMLADVLGLQGRRPLQPCPAWTAQKDDDPTGMGRYGTLDHVLRRTLFERIRDALGVKHFLVAGPREGRVARAAVCPGACGHFVRDALRLGCDFYLTGELRHHDALSAAQAGMTVVCVNHSNSERRILEHLRARLVRHHPASKVRISRRDRDPFVVVSP